MLKFVNSNCINFGAAAVQNFQKLNVKIKLQYGTSSENPKIKNGCTAPRESRSECNHFIALFLNYFIK